MINPYPTEKVICGLCGQSWADHLELTRRELILEQDDDEYTEEPSLAAMYDSVNHEHCIALLKIANRGPEGPPGVQGPMGARA